MPAPPQVVFAAIRRRPCTRCACCGRWALRGLPHLLARRPGFRPAGSAPVLDSLLKVGFILLGERPGAEIAAGIVGRFWRLADSEPAALRTREGFVAFAEPGIGAVSVELGARHESI